MGLYELLVTSYNSVLAIFPPPLQWLVSLLILIALVMGFLALVRRGGIWLLLLIILVPILIPVVARLVSDLWHFFLYLLLQIGVRVG